MHEWVLVEALDDKPPFSAILGARILARRRAEGLERKQVALDAGIAYRTLCRIELGDKCPSVQTLRELARALQCSTDELLGVNHAPRPLPCVVGRARCCG